MPRGEVIGRAWVTVHADTTGIDNDVRRGLRSTKFDKFGTESGEEWGRGFGKAVDAELIGKLRSTFKQGFVTGDFSALGKQFNTNAEAIAFARKQLSLMRDELGMNETAFKKLSGVLDQWEIDEKLVAADRALAQFSKNTDDRLKTTQIAIARTDQALADFSRNQDARLRASQGRFAVQIDTTALKRADEMFKQAFSTGDFTKYAKGFNSIQEATDEAGRSLARMRNQGKLTDDEFFKLSKTLNQWYFAMRNTNITLGTLGASLGRISAMWGQQGSQVKQAVKAYSDADKWMIGFADRISETQAKMREGSFVTGFATGDFTKYAKEFDSVSEAVRTATGHLHAMRDAGRINNVEFRELSQTMGTWVREQRRARSALGDGGIDIGRIFGRGARNNFVNLVGVFVGGISAMARGIVTFPIAAVKGIGSAISSVGDMFAGFKAEGMGSFTAGLTTARTLLVSFGPAIVGVGVGVVAFASLIGAAVSSISLLTGAITAVVSAVSFGLVGALAAALPALVALGAAAGVTAVAFMNMSKRSQEALAPMKKAWEGIATTVSDAFLRDLPRWVGQATSLLRTFVGPTMVGIANTLRDSMTGFMNALTSAQFAPFLAQWRTSMAAISGSLSSALGSAVLGLTALFKPILPFAERLAAKIDEIAGKFRDWAASAKGQNDIAAFMDKAWQAGERLWGILTSVGSAIGTIFGEGQKSGQEFLNWADTELGKWAENLKTPEGQADLRQWFTDAKEFGKQLLSTIGDIGKFLQDLDTPQNRKFATDLQKGIQSVVSAVDAMSPAISAASNVTMALVGSLAAAWGLVLKAVSAVATAVGDFFAVIGKAPGMGWAKDIGEDLQGVGRDADEAAGKMLAFGQQAVAPALGLDTTDFDSDIEGSKALLKGMDKETLVQIGADTTSAIADVQEMKTTIDRIIKPPPPIPVTVDDAGAAASALKARDAIEHLIPPTVNTDFVGDPKGLLDATEEASTGIGTVVDENVTTFGAVTDPLLEGVGRAIWGTGQVPSDKTTMFMGDTGGIEESWGEAIAGVSSVPKFHQTDFFGNPTQLLTAGAQADAVIAKIDPKTLTTMFGDNQDVVRKSVATIAALGLIDPRKLVTIAADDKASPTIRGIAAELAKLHDKQVQITTRYVTQNKPVLQDSFPGVGARGGIAGMAFGGILRGAQVIIAGEAGPEAVVPLRRPLSQVDPAVRELSAYAQGKTPVATGKSVTVAPGAIVVQPASADPVRVAEAVLDRMVVNAI